MQEAKQDERHSGWQFDPASKPTKRLGASPEELHVSTGGGTCPDIWEMTSGDLMIIGKNVTNLLDEHLPEGCLRADDEAIIAIPRATLTSAKLALQSDLNN